MNATNGNPGVSLKAAMQFYFDYKDVPQTSALEVFLSIRYYLDHTWRLHGLHITIGELRWFWARRHSYSLANMYHAPGAPSCLVTSFLFYAMHRGFLPMDPHGQPQALRTGGEWRRWINEVNDKKIKIKKK